MTYILPLRSADLTLGRRREVAEIAVLDPDQVGLVEGEVQMEVDQTVEGSGGVGCIGEHGRRAVQEASTDAHQ